ncbi:MAG TPA: hypothetical protein VJO34_07685 [Methylomirabilota bacterium]|nr:hypothetical protein [Methylomirabilota bacterium]
MAKVRAVYVADLAKADVFRTLGEPSAKAEVMEWHLKEELSEPTA